MKRPDPVGWIVLAVVTAAVVGAALLLRYDYDAAHTVRVDRFQGLREVYCEADASWRMSARACVVAAAGTAAAATQAPAPMGPAMAAASTTPPTASRSLKGFELCVTDSKGTHCGLDDDGNGSLDPGETHTADSP